MADFLESVLSDAEPQAPVESPEVQAPAEPAPAEHPAPIAPETPQEPAVESPVQAKPDAGYAPISALMDERDKRKAAEAERDQLRQQQEPTERPDPFDDPQGYEAYLGQQLEARVVKERFQMSDVIAKQTHGAEAVEAAVAWATERGKSDPTFAMSYMREAHPLDWIVRQHQRDAMVSGLGNVTSLDAWFEQEAAKRGYSSQSAPVAAASVAVVPPVSRPAAPPRSIASEAPASVSTVPDSKAAFEAIFDRR